jgi:hypothetical protein
MNRLRLPVAGSAAPSVLEYAGFFMELGGGAGRRAGIARQSPHPRPRRAGLPTIARGADARARPASAARPARLILPDGAAGQW